jgi:hypothetical protein
MESLAQTEMLSRLTSNASLAPNHDSQQLQVHFRHWIFHAPIARVSGYSPINFFVSLMPSVRNVTGMW